MQLFKYITLVDLMQESRQKGELHWMDSWAGNFHKYLKPRVPNSPKVEQVAKPQFYTIRLDQNIDKMWCIWLWRVSKNPKTWQQSAH